MKELIEKYETKSKVLLGVINHPENTKIVVEKAMACRRFVQGFLSDLKNIKLKG